MMGRRRRRVLKAVKRKLPVVFNCPKCGEEAVRVSMHKGASSASVKCSSCGWNEEVETYRSTQPVDVYCRASDKYYAKPGPPLEETAPEEKTPALGAQDTRGGPSGPDPDSSSAQEAS